MIDFNPVAATRRNVTVLCVKTVYVSFENIHELNIEGEQENGCTRSVPLCRNFLSSHIFRPQE